MLAQDPEELDGDGEINHPLPKDLMFDPWAGLSASVMAVIGPILRTAISALSPDGRKPRVDLVDGIYAIVPALVANLLVLRRERPEGSRLVIGTERRKQTRYDRRGLRKLPEVIRALEVAGLIAVHPAVFRQRRTTIEATGTLKQLLSAPDLRLSDVTRVEGEELIQVTARPEVGRIAGRKQPKVAIDYRDTEETFRLRREMEGINRFLATRDVVLEGSPQPAFRLIRRFTLRRLKDPLQFNLHGRLYGGFWMTLRSTERNRLRIDGEPIADLDFSSMFPNLAYRHVGKDPPPGDLYAISGLEHHREGAKAALSALLSYEAEMQSLPARLKALLPEGWTARRVKEVFATRHPDLVPLFGRDFGLDLMFTESRILLAAIRMLMEKEISLVPMHDGMMVPRSKAGPARLAMEEASEKVTGVRLPVSVTV